MTKKKKKYYLQLQPVHGGISIFKASTAVMFLQPAQEYYFYTQNNVMIGQ